MPVLDDAHDDDDETLTLTPANASGAVLADATATGTIDNNDVMPRALMARFGRLVAGHIVDQVEQRVATPRAPGFDGELAGRAINQAEGFAERSVSVAVNYDPSPATPLGLTARVAPSWGGEAGAGAEALWATDNMGAIGEHGLGGTTGGQRLDTDVG